VLGFAICLPFCWRLLLDQLNPKFFHLKRVGIDVGRLLVRTGNVFTLGKEELQ